MCGRKDRLLIEQIGQLQQHLHRLEEEIERQGPFEASAERLVAYIGPSSMIRSYGPTTSASAGKENIRRA